MIIREIEEQITGHPQRPAIVAGKEVWTYRRLGERADRVAGEIWAIDRSRPQPGENHIAALLFDPGTDMAAALLGAWKAGTICVPLDVNAPEERSAVILGHAGAASLLTDTGHEALARRLEEKLAAPLSIIVVDRLTGQPGGEKYGHTPAGDKPAYIFYNSGPSGQPRGVWHDRQNVCYYAGKWAERLAITAADRLALFFTPGHDGMLLGLVGGLLKGATVVLVDIAGQTGNGWLSDWLTREKITLWYGPADFYRRLENARGKAAEKSPGDLRGLIIGGDQVGIQDIQAFREFFPGTALAVVYGRPECPVNSLWEIGPGNTIHRVLLGESLAGTELLLVNEEDEIVDDFGVGEIVVACDRLAGGYWNEREETERVFLLDPDLGRLFYTGEQGRLLADGSIEFLGKKEPGAPIWEKESATSFQAGGTQTLQPVEKRDYYPLTSMQKRLYLLHQLDSRSTNYNMPLVLIFQGALAVERLTGISQILVQRHESLRTSFTIVDDEPVQRVLDRVELELEVFEIEGQERIEIIVQNFIRPFDLAVAPLIRVGLIKTGEAEHILAIDMHHIICDGTSLGIMTREFLQLYRGQGLPPLKIQYKDFTVFENHVDRQSVWAAREKFWLERFAGEIPTLQLPTDYPRPKIQGFSGDSVRFDFSARQTGELIALAHRYQGTLYMILLALYYVLLFRLSGQEDIVIGTPVAGRTNSDVQDTIGMFVNTLALRHYPKFDLAFEEFLAQVTSMTIEAFDNQDYHLEDLVEKVAIDRDTGRNPLFDVMFVLQNVDIPEIQIPGLTLSTYPFQTGISKFDMTMAAIESDRELIISIEYGTKLFTRQTIERWAGYFQNLVVSVCKDPGQKLADIDIIPPEEKQRLLVEFNDSRVEYPVQKTIPGWFSDQVVKSPDRIAIVGANGNSPLHCSVSYKEVDRNASALAGELIEKGGCPNSIVAIRLERSIEMIVGILGILKAGAAYLPLDPEAPAERVQYMLADSGAEIVFGPQVVGANCRSPIQDIGAECKGERQFAPTDLAYVIYTSGSTGRPKGTLISQQNVIRVVKNTNYIDISEHDRLLQLSNYAFDGSVFDIYGALLNGAALVLIKKEELLSLERLSGLIRLQQITVFFVTTALFNTLVDFDLGALAGVRKILFGGEQVSVGHVKKALAVLGKGRLMHVYGPTETTVFATYYHVQSIEAGAGTIPIGRPLTNTGIYILDGGMRLLPLGVKGEIYIGGEGLARGYLNNPELTEERFVTLNLTPNPSPSVERGDWWSGAGASRCERGAAAIPGTGMLNRIAESPQFVKPQAKLSTVLAGSEGDWCVSPAPHQSPLTNPRTPATTHHSPHTNRLYRTGDLGRWLDDGTIEFLGRIDFQVKIRGFRIEPGEIEAQLLKHPAVKEAVVSALGEANEKYLCAYVVPHIPAKETDVLETEVRGFLSGSLPDYLVPGHFVFLEQIPLTANGKVDRKALPEPGLNAGPAVDETPQTPVERALAGLWADVLHVSKERIGVFSSFFDLGGHSLKAAVLVAHIRRRFDVEVPLIEVFKTPLLQGMARLIAGAKKSGGPKIGAVEEKEYYELSYNQKRLWIIHQLDPSSPAFHMPGHIMLPGPLEIETVARVLDGLARRHESFRTFFNRVGAEPVQRIEKETAVALPVVDLSGLSDEERDKRRQELFAELCIKPFDLGRPPLFRAVLVKLSEDQAELQYNLHHIIADGWSLEVLRLDFTRLYEAFQQGEEAKLERLAVQYRDFAAWQNRVIGDKQRKEGAQAFWRPRLTAGGWELGRLCDFPARRQDNSGAGYRYFIKKEVLGRLKDVVDTCRTSLFVVVFSVYILLFSRHSGQEEVGCSIISAGREDVDLHRLMGFFVHSLLFKLRVDRQETFADFVRRVHDEVMNILRYQGYPVELLLEEMGQRHPDVGISFNMVNLQEIGDLTAAQGDEAYHIPETQAVKFDIELYAVEYENGLELHWRYKREAFLKETIGHIVKRYARMLDFFGLDAAKAIQDYSDGARIRKIPGPGQPG